MQTMNAVSKDLAKKGNFVDREFSMTDADFEFIRKLSKEKTGIELGDHKKEMIYSRIVRRIRQLKKGSFTEYCRFLETDGEQELTHFVNAITTNLTSFFREGHHFEYLKDQVLPELKKLHSRDKKIRIWSAGCSTGEEPYSIAMTLSGACKIPEWNAKILATDLDTNVVAHGKRGIYARDRVDGLPPSIVKNHFSHYAGSRPNESVYEVDEDIKKYVTFNKLNLLGNWPMKGQFDVIFCRNVVIYFNKETQRQLFDRYANILAPNGYLFIGHSESLHGVTKRFESLGRTIYRKIT